MRMQQAALASKTNPRILTSRQAIVEISKTGSSAFFRGTTSAATKEFIKNVWYKGILITQAPNYAHSALSSVGLPAMLTTNQYHFIQSVTAGIFAGTSDFLLGGAFEARATFRATSQGENANARFWTGTEKNIISMIKRCYQGAMPSIIKNSLAFSTSFYISGPIEKSIRNLYGLDDKQKMCWHAKFLACILTGFGVAITSSPFDILKTQSQMPNPNNKKLFEAMRDNYHKYGLHSLTAGLHLKFLMVITGWGMNELIKQREKERAQAIEEFSEVNTITLRKR